MIELKGITWAHPRGLAPMQATASQFEQEHQGVRITWTARSLRDFGEESIVQLAQNYDLLVIDHPFAGMAVRSGCLIPLDEWLSSAFLAEQSQQSVGPSHQSYDYDGHQWALAIDAAAQVSAYRPDILEKHHLALPRTWEDVFALARTTSIALPLDPTGAICSFLTLCANHGEPPGQDLTRLVSRSTGQAALGIMRHLAGIAHPETLDFDPPHALDRMSTTDEVAYCPLLFGYSNYARPGYAPYVCRFTNIPAPSEGQGPRGSILGGAGLAISSRCCALPAACAYAQWVASSECQRTTYVTSGGQPGNRVAWTDPAVNAATSNFFLDTLETLDQTYLRPRYDGFISFHDSAALVLHDYLRRGGDELAILNQLELLYRSSVSGPKNLV
jgi:multiple sugar transport system substrate-binding protein